MADISAIKLPDNTTYTIKDATARTDLANKADKADTVLDTTLSRGRASGTTVGTASFAFGNYVTASGSSAHAEGSGTRATDGDAHAEGSGSAATASAAHAEGAGSTASGPMAHAEGAGSTASGTISHAEGSSTLASGTTAHAEGNLTLAAGSNSHAEGNYTAAAGSNSHAEGTNTAASGVAAHVEGAAVGSSNANTYIKVTGNANVTTYTFTYPSSPYIEVKAGDYLKNGTTVVSVTSVSGSSVTVSATLSSSKLTNYTVYVYKTRASGYAAHAEGAATIASADFAHAEGLETTASDTFAHAEGQSTTASAAGAHAEGQSTTASAANAHAEGQSTTASASSAHAEGQSTTASTSCAHAEGQGTTASGYVSHAEGMYSSALNAACHAEGSSTKADTYSSHAEGGNTYAQNAYSHAEGQYTIATGMASHAEGTASGTYTIKLTGSANATTYTYTMSSGESALKPGAYITYEQAMRKVTGVGSGTVTVASTLSSTALNNVSATLCGHAASGVAAHAEGRDTVASGDCSHAEGQGTSASGNNSHAEGLGTIASEANCHAEGQYNVAPVSGCIHVVGNGTADDARSNAHTLDMQGNAWYAGEVKVGANNDYLLREKNLADRYDATSTYAVGDYCIYGGQLYKCTTAISTAEAWDSTHWTATDIFNGAISNCASLMTRLMTPVSVGTKNGNVSDYSVCYRIGQLVICLIRYDKYANIDLFTGLPKSTTAVAGYIWTNTTYYGQISIATGGTSLAYNNIGTAANSAKWGQLIYVTNDP